MSQLCSVAHNARGGDLKPHWAMKGASVCNKHGGSAPQVRAKAAIRAEVLAWGLMDGVDDPGETMLRLITQSRRRAEGYAIEMERVVATFPTLQEALVGDTVVVDREGIEHKAGEYVRGLAILEAEERDRCFGFSLKAVAAGLKEREVRIAEREAELLATWVREFISDPELGIDQEVAKRVASRHLRALPAA